MIALMPANCWKAKIMPPNMTLFVVSSLPRLASACAAPDGGLPAKQRLGSFRPLLKRHNWPHDMQDTVQTYNMDGKLEAQPGLSQVIGSIMVVAAHTL